MDTVTDKKKINKLTNENQHLEKKILKDLKEEKREIEYIEKHIECIRERLLDRVPDRFSKRDAINAFFGSLTIGITFILKGATVKTAVGLDLFHTILVFLATWFVLLIEIYFIGYSRVKDKNNRKFGQFAIKRLICLYGIAVIISLTLVYLLNLNHSEYVTNNFDMLKIVILVSFPCAIGAAVPSLLKKY